MGGISNNPQVSNWGNVGFQGAHVGEGVDTNSFGGFVDGSTNLGGVWGNDPYLQDINTPALAAAVLGLSDAPNGTPGETEYSPTHAFYDSFAENLQNLADQNGLSEEQVNQLLFSHLTGVPSDDARINELLGELDAQVAGDMAEMFELPSTGAQAGNLRERAGNHAGSVQAQIEELEEYAKSLPEGSEKQAIQDKIGEMKENLKNFNDQLNDLPDNPSRQQLAELSTKLGMSGENLKNLAGELSELAKNNPELQSLVAKFESSIGSSVNQLDGLLQELFVSYQISQGDFSSFTEDFQNLFASKLSKAFDAEFEAQLEQHTSDPELQAQLRFAHYNPDANVGSGIRSLAEQIQQAAINQLNAEGWAIPQNYTPSTDSLSYNFKMQSAGDDMFEAMLDNYVNPDGTVLTEAQKNQVRNMYYGVTPQSGVLGDIAAEMEATIGAELATAFGLPPGSPTPKGGGHSLSIDGTFQLKFMELLNALSPEQKAEVLKAINDPMNSSISEETKQLLNQLFNQAADSVRAQYGLSSDWSPSTDAIRGAANPAGSNESAAGAISTLENEVALAITYVEQWPNSPTKAMLLNVLKVVSEAISELKQQLAIIMQLDAQLSTKLGQAQLDTALLKVHENLTKIQEIQDKQAKMEALGPLFKIFEVFMLIFAVALCFLAGPVVGTILAALVIADFAVKQSGALGDDTGIFKAMFDGIMEAFQDLLGEEAGFFLGAFFCMAVLLPLIAVNPIMGMQMFFENSGIIQTFFTDVCGCDPMVGEIVAMALGMIAEIVMMILLTVFTGGAGAPLLVANITANVAKAVGTAAKVAAQVLRAVANAMKFIANAVARLGRVGQMIGKGLKGLAKSMKNLADSLKSAGKAMTKWADEVMEQSVKIMRRGHKIKWSKSLKNAFKGGNKTGDKVFDDAVTELLDNIKIMKYAFQVLGGAYTVLQVSTVSAQFANSITAAQIARIRGDMEAMMTELEAFIQVLKKILNKILESLSGMGEWMGQIGQQQGSMWSDLSQSMDAIAACNQAS